MLRQISIRQFNEWRAYADLEPFDDGRADLRAASIVCALLNVHRAKGKPAVKLKDCVLRFGDEANQNQATTPEQARAQTRLTLEMLTALTNKPPSKRR